MSFGSLSRLRLDRAKARFREQAAVPTDPQVGLAGDGVGNVVMVPGSDWVYVRDQSGRVTYARNLSGHVWLDGDSIPLQRMSNGPEPAAWKIPWRERGDCPPTRVRGNMYASLGGWPATTGGRWAIILPDGSFANIGKHADQNAGLPGGNGIVRDGNLYCSLFTNGTLDGYGAIARYNPATSTWTRINYPTVGGLPAATRLRPMGYNLDNAGIIWIYTIAFVGATRFQYMFKLDMADTISYVSTLDFSPAVPPINNFDTFLFHNGTELVPGNQIIGGAPGSLTWRVFDARLNTASAPRIIDPDVTSDAEFEAISFVDHHCNRNMIWTYQRCLDSGSLSSPFSPTPLFTYVTPDEYANWFSVVRNIYLQSGRAFGIRQDNLDNDAGDNVNIWNAATFYGATAMDDSETIYTLGEIMPDGTFRGIFGFSHDDGTFISDLSGNGSGDDYFFINQSDVHGLSAGVYRLNIPTETVTAVIDSTTLTNTGQRGAFAMVGPYVQGQQA